MSEGIQCITEACQCCSLHAKRSASVHFLRCTPETHSTGYTRLQRLQCWQYWIDRSYKQHVVTMKAHVACQNLHQVCQVICAVPDPSIMACDRRRCCTSSEEVCTLRKGHMICSQTLPRGSREEGKSVTSLHRHSRPGLIWMAFQSKEYTVTRLHSLDAACAVVAWILQVNCHELKCN